MKKSKKLKAFYQEFYARVDFVTRAVTHCEINKEYSEIMGMLHCAQLLKAITYAERCKLAAIAFSAYHANLDDIIGGDEMNSVQMKNHIAKRTHFYIKQINATSDISSSTIIYEKAYGALLITSELNILNITEFKELALLLNIAYADKMLSLTSK